MNQHPGLALRLALKDTDSVPNCTLVPAMRCGDLLKKYGREAAGVGTGDGENTPTIDHANACPGCKPLVEWVFTERGRSGADLPKDRPDWKKHRKRRGGPLPSRDADPGEMKPSGGGPAPQ